MTIHSWKSTYVTHAGNQRQTVGCERAEHVYTITVKSYHLVHVYIHTRVYRKLAFQHTLRYVSERLFPILSQLQGHTQTGKVPNRQTTKEKDSDTVVI